ncbi:MAG: C10 family peptidase [Bacteroidales bacterium]|nr:C10 family peptidase [Bacteroidales bacterium]
MKTYLWKSIYFMFVVMFIACTQDDGVVCEVEETLTRAEISGSQLYKPSTLGLLKTYIEKVKFADKKSGTQYTLKPYEFEGDTVMYVANYENGWELLSADERTPIVLASSRNGSYNEEVISGGIEAFIGCIAQEIAVLRKDMNGFNNQHEQWKTINPNYETNRAISNPTTYGYWTLVEISTPQVISADSISHLITTHWHQESPFNSYTPLSSNYHTAVGCAPVAVGQYLYFLYEKNGNIWSIPRYAYLNTSTNTNTFSDFSTNWWQYLGKVQTDSGKLYTAALLTYLGNLMGADYGLVGTGVSPVSMLSTINTFVSPQMSSHNYDSNFVLSRLQSGYPVLASASTDAVGQEGHAFVIDKYKTITRRTTYTYGWVALDQFGNIQNPMDIDGGIVGYDYYREENVDLPITTISMNWGKTNFQTINYWQFRDDIEFSSYGTSWILDSSTNYHYNRKIYY